MSTCTEEYTFLEENCDISRVSHRITRTNKTVSKTCASLLFSSSGQVQYQI